MTTIRQLKLADGETLDRLVEYGKKFWHQTLYYEAGVEYDKTTVVRMTTWLAETGIVLYAEDDGEIVGLMLIVVGPFPMNDKYKAGTEWVFYVDPMYRKEGVGQHMINIAEEALQELDVKFLSMISLANVQPEAAEGLYKSLGYKHTETSFTKDLG